VLVGEMRDLETIDAAITAAETGHLVFGTLHTTGAKNGMVTLDSFLIEKYLAGMIAREEVVTKAQDPVTIQAKLQELELAQAVGVDMGAAGAAAPARG